MTTEEEWIIAAELERQKPKKVFQYEEHIKKVFSKLDER